MGRTFKLSDLGEHNLKSYILQVKLYVAVAIEANIFATRHKLITDNSL